MKLRIDTGIAVSAAIVIGNDVFESCQTARSNEKDGQKNNEMVWVDPDHEAPPGTEYKTFHSKIINADVSYLVYLPPDYEQNQAARYPVIYYLPATGGMPKGDAVEIGKRLDRALREGRAAPMIAIFVNGLRGNTMYCDSKDGRYPVESVIVKDLIPHVDGTYRTIASRESRAIEGGSMGGFGAAHLGFKYPELFGVISILAPAFLGPELTQQLPAGAWSRLFPVALGGDLALWKANEPFGLAARNADALRDRTLIRLACHLESENWAAPRCEELHKILVEHTLAHEYFYFANVKSHNRKQILDSLGDVQFAYFGSSLTRGPSLGKP